MFQRENYSLKYELDTLNGKYDAELIKVRETIQENAELNDILSATKSKMAELSAVSFLSPFALSSIFDCVN